jgi:ferritin-like metal-binding protein YciE
MTTEVTRHLLVDELTELYDIESQMSKALPGMAELATLPRLKAALQSQLAETHNQIERLARLLAGLGQTVRRRTTRTLGRLIDEGGRLILHAERSEAVNRELLKLARYVEEYEITACGCAITYAELLGYVDVVRVLRVTLEEKEATEAQLIQAEDRHAGAYLRPSSESSK